jgi:hypothetical protein
MIAHRHTSRAASLHCTDPDCLARYAAALERGAADIARIDDETTAKLRARTAHSTVAWAAIIGQVPAWQAAAREASQPHLPD